MGIYISGINLPKGKHSIVEITITEDGTVFTGSTDTFHKSDLRAVEIPTRHGRLIDADELMAIIREHDYPLRGHFNSTDNGMFTIGIQEAVDTVENFIEAEGK